MLEYNVARLAPRSNSNDMRWHRLGSSRGRIKQDARGSAGKPRIIQKFRQIVDEVRAAHFRNLCQFRLFGWQQEYAVTREADRLRIEEFLPLKPRQRRLVKVIGWAAIGVARLMADDEYCSSSAPAFAEERFDAFKRLRKAHPRPVCLTLHFRPNIFLAGSAKVIPHRTFIDWYFVGDQLPLQGQRMKQLVVAHDGIVEVDANAHLAGGCLSSVRQRPTSWEPGQYACAMAWASFEAVRPYRPRMLLRSGFVNERVVGSEP